jgi:hypothetical protein
VRYSSRYAGWAKIEIAPPARNLNKASDPLSSNFSKRGPNDSSGSNAVGIVTAPR